MSDANSGTNRAGILVMAVCTALITTYSASALNLAIPSMGAEFHSSAAALNWLLNVYLLCSVCLALPLGKLADAFSRRAILIFGCCFYLLFSTLAVFCHSMTFMLVLRVGQGVGAAMLFATNIAILVDAFPANKRGWVRGVYTASTYAGLSLGPVLGGILTDAFGWRSVFVSMVIVCVAALVSSLAFVPKRKAAPLNAAIDWRGMGCYIVSLLMLLYGLSAVVGSWYGPVLAVAGAIGCVLFCRFELRTSSPMIDIRIFLRNPNFALSNVAAMFNYAATFAVSYLMSIYLQEIKGMSAWQAGLFMVCQPVLQAIISPISGRLADHHSPFKLASAGMAVCTVALVCFTFFQLSTPLAFVMATLLIIGVGFGLFSSPNQTAIMSSVSAQDYGMASSLIATSRNIGQVLCMALITTVTSIQLSGLTLAAATKNQIMISFRLEFIIFAAICAVGVFISLQRKSGKVSSQ
jgi:EmrB/QacA subfamily drug resistance transporter